MQVWIDSLQSLGFWLNGLTLIALTALVTLGWKKLIVPGLKHSRTRTGEWLRKRSAARAVEFEELTAHLVGRPDAQLHSRFDEMRQYVLGLAFVIFGAAIWATNLNDVRLTPTEFRPIASTQPTANLVKPKGKASDLIFSLTMATLLAANFSSAWGCLNEANRIRRAVIEARRRERQPSGSTPES